MTGGSAAGSGGSPTSGASAPGDLPLVWDLPGLTATRRPGVIVVGEPGPELSALADAAQAARAQVGALWPTNITPVIVDPVSDDAAAGLLGLQTADLVGTSAITDGPLTPGAAATRDRIVLVPSTFRALPSQGQDVVLRHELTHALVRATTTAPVPVWLSEGFAEFVAYHDSDLPTSRIAPALTRLVEQGRAPDSLPADGEFARRDTREVAYGSAWLAVTAIARVHGIDGPHGLLAFYREAAVGTGDAEARARAALGRVLGWSPQELETAWRSQLALAPQP